MKITTKNLVIYCTGIILLSGIVWFGLDYVALFHRESTTKHAEIIAPGQNSDPARYVGNQQCAACHQQQYKLWQGSHHDRAMEVADDNTVLGDFNDKEFSYYHVTSRFFKRDDKFMVHTDGPDGQMYDYEIKYTFGFDPLQQYLIEFPGGRYQVLSIAWDSRPQEQGGQRWFHLYPEENIDHESMLHWTKLNQNWNYMCAECHSTNLQKNYNAQEENYHTTWSEIDVSCEACHGPGSIHIAWAKKENIRRKMDNKGLLVNMNERAGIRWKISARSGNAKRSRYKKTNIEIETCARCHARRGILSEEYQHNKPLLDTHRLALLDQDLYYPDGQIKGEVYVYGSFLQSKMYHEGVTCSDCHEPHSLKLRAPDNGVCLTCHSADKFNTPEHHFHQLETAGASCVECHMPETTYMVVDPRRDHSIRIPRPDLSLKTAVPNACNRCHTDKPPAWAAAYTEMWYHPLTEGYQLYAEVFTAAYSGKTSSQELLTQLASNAFAPAIARATAFKLLHNHLSPGVLKTLQQGLAAADPLMRHAAISALEGLSPQLRWQLLVSFLEDPVRVVRIEAARVLADIPVEQMQSEQASAFNTAAEEYITAQMINADRPEAQMNLGNYYAGRGWFAQAEQAYQQALKLQPSLIQAYVNLADLNRLQGQDDKGERLLRKALSIEQSADVQHALGLLLIRQQQLVEARTALALAAKLAPENPRYAYVYAIAMHNAGQVEQALTILEQAHHRRPDHWEIVYALATFNRDAGNVDAAVSYAEILVALFPQDANASKLLDQLLLEKNNALVSPR